MSPLLVTLSVTPQFDGLTRKKENENGKKEEKIAERGERRGVGIKEYLYGKAWGAGPPVYSKWVILTFKSSTHCLVKPSTAQVGHHLLHTPLSMA